MATLTLRGSQVQLAGLASSSSGLLGSISHLSDTVGCHRASHHLALLYSHLQLSGPRAWPILAHGLVILGSHHLTWPLSSWAQHLTSVSVDLAITHPSSASPPPSFALGLTLASRALYMVGFHSFVCTFGEGLLCARPCARHQVNGLCPWECTPRGDAQEPADGREPGQGWLGGVVQRRAALTTWGGGWGAQQGAAEWGLGGELPRLLCCWRLTSQEWSQELRPSRPARGALPPGSPALLLLPREPWLLAPCTPISGSTSLLPLGRRASGPTWSLWSHHSLYRW